MPSAWRTCPRPCHHVHTPATNPCRHAFWTVSSAGLESIFSVIKHLHGVNRGKQEWQTLNDAALIRLLGDKPWAHLSDKEIEAWKAAQLSGASASASTVGRGGDEEGDDESDEEGDDENDEEGDDESDEEDGQPTFMQWGEHGEEAADVEHEGEGGAESGSAAAKRKRRKGSV